ncbi:MAG: putative ATPase, partial [Bradymonadia bacterium]
MHDGIVQIVMEDNDLVSLREAMRRRRLGLRDALGVARDVAKTLVRLHAVNIVHKDINPANILFRPGEQAILIDFGVASILPRERAELRPMELFEGTLLYAAPEQTGRMNRPIDSRTDLYSLGATLFEVLGGRPPFVSKDPLELVHSHLARPAPSLREVAPQVPAPVARIVDRLLAKHAEDRYQTAGSLQADLERCLRTLSESGEVTEFVIGESEYAPRFRLRDVLYGRKVEIAAVEAACSRVAHGGSEVVLLAGAPGIGKSALASEAQRALAFHGGRLIRGKAEQLNRVVPFAPFLEAFEELVEHLLALPDDVLDVWRRRFEVALGVNSRVLTNEIDALQLIVGEGQPLDAVSPAEADNRFRTVVQRFVGAIASADEPLGILLDDLQWADPATLELLRSLAVDPDIRHLIILGTYRDNEVDANSALSALVRKLEEAGVRLESHTLEALEAEALAEMLAHAVDREPAAVRTLAARICQKTGGNPFFARCLALDLARRNAIRYDTREKQWTWELKAVDDARITENVVGFMAALVADLPVGTRQALESAAFLGSRFELGLLAELLDEPIYEVQENLRGALEEDLVAPVGEGYWYLRPEDLEYGPAPEFVLRFAHDRIAKAVIDGLDIEASTQMHLRIGRTLKSRLTTDAEKELIFQVVGHLNEAQELLEPDEAVELAELNERAADRAVASAAFGAGFGFYRRAVILRGEAAWLSDYAATIRLHQSAGVAALRAGEFAAMEELVAGIEERANCVSDRVSASAIRIESFVLRNEHLAGVEAALDALDALGVSLPRSPSEDDTGAFLGKVLGRLSEHPPTEIQGMRSLDDAGMALARRILVGMTTAAYLAKPEVFAFIPLTLVDNTLDHGVSDESAYGFVLLAMVLTVVGLLEQAAPLGELSVALLERSETRRMHTPVLHVWNTHVRVFHEPVSSSASALPDVLRLGLELGDLEYGGWATHNHSILSFYAGWSLDTVAQHFGDDLRSIERCNHLGAKAVHLPFMQLVSNLRGEGERADRLIGPDYNAVEAEAEYLETGYRGASFLLAVARLINRVLCGDPGEAADIAAAGEQYQDGASATQHVVAFYFYDALANVMAIGAGDGAADAARLERAQSSRDKLEPFVAACPQNHQHRAELLDAELARHRGQVRDAIAHYNRAGTLAESNGFVGEEGLVYERAGIFYFELEAPTPARAYLKRANYCYDRW